MTKNLNVTQYEYDVSTAITIIVNMLDDIRKFATPEEQKIHGYLDMVTAFKDARETLHRLQLKIETYESNYNYVSQRESMNDK